MVPGAQQGRPSLACSGKGYHFSMGWFRLSAVEAITLTRHVRRRKPEMSCRCLDERRCVFSGTHLDHMIESNFSAYADGYISYRTMYSGFVSSPQPTLAIDATSNTLLRAHPRQILLPPLPTFPLHLNRTSSPTIMPRCRVPTPLLPLSLPICILIPNTPPLRLPDNHLITPIRVDTLSLPILPPHITPTPRMPRPRRQPSLRARPFRPAPRADLRRRRTRERRSGPVVIKRRRLADLRARLAFPDL
jgi:hypothetical protein